MNVRNLVRIMVAVAIAVMSIAGIGGVAVAAPAGSITGTVTDNSGTPIAGARVDAWDWDTADFMGRDTTDAYGIYTITGLESGTYRIRAYADGYFAYYYDGVFTVAESTAVTVTDPNPTSGKDFSLVPGTNITGHVYQEGTTTAIQGARVSVWENITDSGSWKWLAGGSTNPEGFYTITAFSGPGSYKVRAEKMGWAGEFYDNVTSILPEDGDPVPVTADDDTTDIDFYLAQSGYISGTVYEADGVTPLGGATITARDNTTTLWEAENDSADGTGFYYINLPPGTYRLVADEDPGHMPQWWDNVTVVSGGVMGYWGDATPVTVVGTDPTTDKDFSLLTAQAVETNAANGIGTTSATLNGDLTSMGANDNVTVSFEWGTAPGVYTETTDNQTMTDTGVFSAPRSGLTPDTPYYFRAKAVGDVDTTPFYGVEVSFATSTVPPSVTTNAASLVTITSATLNGNLAAMGTASSVTVSFAWGTAAGGPYTNPVTVSPDMTAAGAFSAPLSGLAPGTTYYYIARAVGDGSVDGAQMSFTTSTTLPTVTTSAASLVTTASATLNSSLTARGTASSVIVSFEWGTTAGGPYTNVTDNQTMTSTGAFTANLTGLTAGTTYYCKAKAVGHGTAFGDEVSFTTSTTPPTVTTSAGNLTDLGTASSVIVSFEWGLTTSYGSETSAQSVLAIGAFSANLTGLTANTAYHFRTKAVGHGVAVYGTDMTFSTADTIAPAISLANASEITTSGATVTWTTNEAATSQVEYGLTEEYGSVSPLDASLVNSHSVDLTGLKAGKTYHYRVISKDAANNQAVSADATFKTAASSGGMPVWAWVLIGLAAVGVLGGAGYFAFTKMGKQK
jgi:hypothetical protein